MPSVIEELVFAFGYKIDAAALDRASKAARSNARQTEADYKRASKEVELAQKRLAAAVDAASKAAAKSALDAATEARDAAKSALEDMGRDVDKLHGKLGEKVGGVLKSIGVGLAGLGVAGVAALGGIVVHGVEQARELDQWSKKLGTTTDELQRLERAAEANHVEGEVMRKTISKLREGLGELAQTGAGPAKEALGALGIKFKDIEKLPIEQQLGLIGDALNSIPDAGKRTSATIKLLGEDGLALLPVLLQGTNGIRDMGDAAERAGLIMDESLIATARDLDDKLRVAKGQLASVGLVILETTLPAINDVAKGVGDFVTENQELIKQDLPAVLEGIGDAAKLLIGIFAGVARGLSSVRDEISELKNETREGKGFLGGAVDLVNRAAGLEYGPSGKLQARGKSARDRADFNNPDLWEATSEFAVGGENGGAANDARVAGEMARMRAERLAASGQERKRRGMIAERERAEREAKNAGKSKGKGKTEAEKALTQALVDVKTIGLEDDLRALGANAGASDKAIQAAIKASAEQYAKGANRIVSKKAGVGVLSGMVGVDLSKKQTDPLLSAIFGTDQLPDVPISELERGQQPQVLIATINNTYNVNVQIPINGARDAAATGGAVADAMRGVFRDEVGRVSKFSKVTMAR